MAIVFGLENPTFLVKSDFWIPKCIEGGGPPVSETFLKNSNFCFDAFPYYKDVDRAEVEASPNQMAPAEMPSTTTTTSLQVNIAKNYKQAKMEQRKVMRWQKLPFLTLHSVHS